MKLDINQRSNIIYLSHGGGPLPVLGDASHDKMIEFMRKIPSEISKPDAIIVFSAHWEENVVTIQSGEKPSMMYDYYGFPKEAYDIKYPCKGDKKLAIKISNLLESAGLNCRLDDKRPYDHGSYIPLMMMYPDADIPVVQVSLHHNLDSKTHLSIGKALRPLLDENLLIIGSGFSFHNMRNFDFSARNAVDALNDQFQNGLIQICCEELDESARIEALIKWENISGARYCHPREEHLLPLMVCAGMAGDIATKVFDDYIIGKRAIGFLWRG